MHLLKKRSLVFYLGFVLVLTVAIGGATIGAFAAGPSGSQSIILSNTGSLGVSGAFGTVDGTGALDGTNHPVPYTLKVDVANEGVSLTGWHVSISGDDMKGNANSGNTLTEHVDHVISSGCDITDSDCTPALPIASEPTLVPITATPTSYFSAASASGLGTIDVQTKINVDVLAATVADTYSTTLTLSIDTGP